MQPDCRGAACADQTDLLDSTTVVRDLWLYIQMQFCTENTLHHKLETRVGTKVDMAQALHTFLMIAQGLRYVHETGLIHRDLKVCTVSFLMLFRSLGRLDASLLCIVIAVLCWQPANCFLLSDGTLKIGDFGLSRSVSGKEDPYM